ncbi:hypothetical protein [Streptomyces sp. NPDC048639]|uniref:hypothetical protein n=1 Tax=Streptomyces sp. NPDC048639 TaxID=3365581 RepID=UPI0037219C17
MTGNQHQKPEQSDTQKGEVPQRKTLLQRLLWRREMTPEERKRWWDARAEMGPWEQKEAILARVTELEAILEAVAKGARKDEDRKNVAPAYAAKARGELRQAKGVLEHKAHPAMRRRAHLGVAQSHVDAAVNLIVWLAPEDDVKAMLPQMVALVEEHFDNSDPRRIRVAEIAREIDEGRGGVDPSQRAFLAETVSLARRLLRRETLRVRSFVRIVVLVTGSLVAAAIAIAVLGFQYKTAVPLCFVPENMGEYRVVCPTNDSGSEKTPIPPNTTQIEKTAQPEDYLVVEIAGCVAATISSAASLRRIRGTALPYNVPLVLAALKLPTGALTAVLGLLLMRGGFVPGLSALDSTAQIIAWAIIFGYSQQLFTKFVDSQGQALLDSVGGPINPPQKPAEEVRQ